MSWVKLDDGFVDHPKVVGLDDRAFRWFVWSLTYAARYLTNGFVSEDALTKGPTIARPSRDHSATKKRDRDRPRRRLVQAGLWEEIEGGIEIHDYLAYNRDRARVLKEREANAERIARYREKKKKARNASSNGVTAEGCNATPDPTASSIEEARVGEAAPLRDAAPPPETACFTCEREGLDLSYFAGQWWCSDCGADYQRPGGLYEAHAEHAGQASDTEEREP